MAQADVQSDRIGIWAGDLQAQLKYPEVIELYFIESKFGFLHLQSLLHVGILDLY